MKINRNPKAICQIQGNNENRNIKGIALFFESDSKVLIQVRIKGISVPRRIRCNQPIMGLHIHEKGDCTSERNDPFKNALGHYNPHECAHPYHAGDLGNLFINKDGSAFMCMLTDRFTIQEVINRSMILHQMLDDFTTQPAGNSGIRIACGVIKGFTRS